MLAVIILSFRMCNHDVALVVQEYGFFYVLVDAVAAT